MLENVVLQVAEDGCYTTKRSQQLAIVLAGLGWAWGEPEYPELLGMKNEKCAHASLLRRIARKVAGGVIN